MLVRLKSFLILVVSIFALVAAVIYVTKAQPYTQQQFSVVQPSQETLDDPERSHYVTIPLETINSALQGSDPATLALNAFDETELSDQMRKVEVVYPQHNQALVTITQTKNDLGAIKYRVEMTTFGRSLLVSSPPVWQIVWAGSQIPCWSGSPHQKRIQCSAGGSETPRMNPGA